MRRGRFRALIAFSVAAAIVAAAAFGCYALGAGGDYEDAGGSWTRINRRHSFGYVENHPAFSAFSSFIQPWKDRGNLLVTPHLSMDFVCRINHFNADSIVDGLNFMIDQAEAGELMHRFYTEAEIQADPSKAETGLLFIPGDPGAPFAVVSAGGAFKAVCMFAEAFPTARILHERGYNVFLLKYRVDPYMTDPSAAEAMANEDYARAMGYIFDNAEQLGVGTDGYSVWGFSAGGRLTHLWGMDSDCGYRIHSLPAPAAMVLVYSGWYDEQFDGQYATQPPTYLAWLDNDDTIGADNVAGIRRYIDFLGEIGTPVRDDVYHQARHGFGEGRGTDAEGWIDHALAFWEEQR